MREPDVLKQVVATLVERLPRFRDYRLTNADMPELRQKDFPRGIVNSWRRSSGSVARLVSPADSVGSCGAGSPAAVQVKPIKLCIVHLQMLCEEKAKVNGSIFQRRLPSQYRSHSR